ncbi:hypothetical protein CFP56_038497, partial [Quercus suber]
HFYYLSKGEIMVSVGYFKELWVDWNIEVLVLVSFVLQIILTIFGSRRRYIPGIGIRFAIWSAYLLSNYVAKIAIGKLTDIDTKQFDLSEQKLKGLLAPLIFVQIGSPDTITALSIEDNRLGLRQFLGLLIQVGVVILIIVRFWDRHSSFSFLFLLMFLAGISKYGETVWALSTALTGESGISISEFDQEENVPTLLRQLPESIRGVELILKAYYRFSCLKPHLENWLYKPLYESLQWMSIDGYSAEDVLRITDSELGFMYDVLYTKAPIIYTWQGCILRIISFLSLVSALCGLAILSSHACAKVKLQYLVFTYVLLIGGVVLELYQIILLPFTEWAILKMMRYHNMPVVMQCLRVLGPKSTCHTKRSLALERYACLNDEFKWSVKRDFDKSIIIWHIATDICYHSDVQYGVTNSQIEMGKLLSNYMMYVLVMRPHMFYSTTANIIFQHTYTKLMILLRTRPSLVKGEGEACRILRMEELPEESDSDERKEPWSHLIGMY